MYTKSMFGLALKERIANREHVEQIGEWAYSMYLEHIEEINDPEFDNILLTLTTMELGPEFAYTYEELDKIADDLIAGKDVKL